MHRAGESPDTQFYTRKRRGWARIPEWGWLGEARDPDVGARELRTLWQDPGFQADQDAFYYVRALENPTCRWSTYDALRLGRKPDPRVPATLRERAWSSPIWIDAS